MLTLVGEEGVCADCGTALGPGDAVGGLCPSCLLEFALSTGSLETEAFEPDDAPPLVHAGGRFAEGEVKGARYRIRSRLGRGGMGEVWRAYDLKLRQDVALKALLGEQIEDAGALEMLRQEVRVAREVISPNVCRVFDLQEIEGQEVVSMEYIDGTTLTEVLEARSPLELDEAREIASQFLAGLEAVHDAGLVHRDIKPENIMITRTGRVVVMDFGIAKALQDGGSGFAGTPAYMSPEQRQVGDLDARADVFSAGVVLAEMVEPGGVRSIEDRRRVWERIHEEATGAPETAWGAVVSSATAADREQRYSTAAELARALEEVTLRALGDESARPYPGLAAFQEKDAQFFFGRELEVEALWKKLRRPHLSALIGPSGAGKSSFLRAGLIPVLPESWRVIVAMPGDRPFDNLAWAVEQELSGNPGVAELLERFEEPDVALELFHEWRQTTERVLVVIDQFEELFTQSPSEVQIRFAEMLGRLSLDADVDVLLSMRDDFLFHCQTLAPLAPVFSDMTPLGAPTGASLRRAIVQPALKCGYRFESEALVEAMLSEVEGERGALPMIAFAAAQLWEERDRESGLLTTSAYEQIGGVAGALAQHAERALARIGEEKLPVVRELFRNLVTAQGTRATRDRDDLLSVFRGEERDRAAAETVLDALVDDRLLTSYEVSSGEAAAHRIEIVHESLLSHWPRLVQWQAQDREGALLRDQLRQAAQMWEERGRPNDLLWSGTSLREYELWRERHSFSLSSAEERFAQAMLAKAETSRRRRRLVLAAVIGALAIGLGVVGSLWRQAEKETRRAEASKLLALAQLEVESFPTGALAYVIGSLELADTHEGRRAALGILQRGPVAQVLDGTAGFDMSFSRDGEWLVVSNQYQVQPIQLYSSDGRAWSVGDPAKGPTAFAPDGDMLFRVSEDPTSSGQSIERWSLPDLGAMSSLRVPGELSLAPPLPFGVPVWDFVDWEAGIFDLSLWPAGAMRDEALELEYQGRISDFPINSHIDPTGRWIVGAGRPGLLHEGKLLIRPLSFEDEVESHELTHSWPGIRNMQFSSDGEWLAAQDHASDEIAIWDLQDGSAHPFRTLAGSDSPDPLSQPEFSQDRSRLAMVSSANDTAYVWDLEVPLDGRPTVLPNKALPGGWLGRFHPNGQWVATLHGDSVAFWPTEWPSARIVSPSGDPDFYWIGDVAFTPDSKWLGACSNRSGLHLWPLQAQLEPDLAVPNRCVSLAVDPSGPRVVTSRYGPEVTTIGSAEPDQVFEVDMLKVIAGSEGLSTGVAVDATGRFAVVNYGQRMVVWDLASGESRELASCSEKDLAERIPCGVSSLGFSADSGLLTGGGSGVRSWDVASGRFEWLIVPDPQLRTQISLSGDGRRLLTLLSHRSEEPIGPGAAPGSPSDVELWWRDLVSGAEMEISGLPSEEIFRTALDTTGDALAVGTRDGEVWVRQVDGGEPHLLLGPAGQIVLLAFSPDGRWIAGATGGEIWLWPTPNLEEPPFHLLPYDEFLARLYGLTNVRAVEDPASSSGWSLEIGPFNGWTTVPEW